MHIRQAEITDKLSLLLKEKISIVGCGRTDTGVHAREFYAHFEILELRLDEKDLVYKLNNFLPSDIVIFDIYKVAPDMHCRFSAISRIYKYYISLNKNPFNENTSYFFNGELDIAAMRKACDSLYDYTDFTSFSKLHTQTTTNNCNIQFVEIELDNNDIVFTIRANRFLRNMVRAIMGTLVEIGKGKIKAVEINDIVKAKDRSQAGFSVPAHGLFLERVVYLNQS